jgi:hypothetical protein
MGRPPSLMPHASHTPVPPPSAIASATVSAAPQLRDLKKEATAFVPTALKRKKGTGPGAHAINAAPPSRPLEGGQGEHGENGEEQEDVPQPERTSLLGTLRGAGVLGGGNEEEEREMKRVKKHVDGDYERFLKEVL